MKFLAMFSVYLALPIAASAQVVIIAEPTDTPSAAVPQVDPPPTEVPRRPAVFLTSKTVCSGGYCWRYSNGGIINETFAEAKARTGKNPPETAFQCSSGYCGTAARSPTLATGGCRCGCAASSCNCGHSPNVGKPLNQQRVEPGTVKESSTVRSNTRPGLFGRIFRR